MLLKKTLFLFIGIATYFICPAQIDHVEPLNWWVGMKDPAVQLLINGNDVGATIPVINYSGVTIKKVSQADSKNYLFIDLLIAKNTKPGSVAIHFKKDGKIVYTYNYSLLPREKGSAALKGFDASDAIYLITPDRFVNGDNTNDVVQGMKENKINRNFEGARHGGDIRGIINSLDYIAAMGFTAIWPTPMLENDMPAYSYHGYAITDHYKVDPRFGTLEEYKELSVKAKQKGIKLIYDGVINHTGSYYWWMKDLPFKDWINYQDSSRPTNHRRTVNEDVYAASYDKDIMKKGWFDKMMPDMNGQNPFMANYLIQNSIWWVETLQLGGIRQDTYCYSDKYFSKDWSCRIMNEYPNFTIVGEEWSLNPLITSYWQKGKQNKDGYTSCLTTIMDFPMQEALVQALKQKEANRYEDGMNKIYESLANDFVYADPNNILIMGDNHDMDRLYTQLNKDAALTQMALTYLLTTRGIPQVYYGTEVLMDNTGHHKNDGIIRSDFPGGWKNDSVNAFTGSGLSADQLKMQTFLKKILNWRKTAPAVYNGKTLHFAPFNKVYVYFRYTAKQMIMVIMNKNETAVTIDNKRFAEILGSKTQGTEILTNSTIVLNSNLNIEGKTAMVIEIK
jgi:neopullulanase